MKMNLWKPIALLSTSAFVLMIGYQAASARTSHPAPASVAGNQPNMEAALAKLQEARSFLDKAEHNKGGWRAAAVQSTDNAIRETKRGIAFADQ
jgi:hypothetical protein